MMERAAREARFRERLLTEAINQLLVDDLAAGKAMLRDCVNLPREPYKRGRKL